MSEEIVYGEFGKWESCKFQGELVKGWILTNSLLGFDVNLLTGYASYLLSQVGYLNDRLERTGWIDYLLVLDIVSVMVDLFSSQEPPEEVLKKKDGSRMGIVTVSFHLDPTLEKFGGGRAAEWRQKMTEPYELGGLVKARIEPRCEDAFFLIDPRIIEENGENFRKEKEIARNLARKDIYLSPEEVAKQYIPNRASRLKVNAEWRKIRNKAIMKLTREYPGVRLFLTRSMNEIEVHNLQVNMIQAEKKMQNDHYKDAIRDAGEVCEGLLQLVCGREFCWRDFLEWEEDLERDFGKDIVRDFKIVRELRHKFSHAGSRNPTRDEAFKAVERANFILNYFLEKSGAARGI